MTLSDQIAIGHQKINSLMEGLQELNQERLVQEEENTLLAISQTFDLLIQILVERKENLLLKTKEIYEDAFASVYQRRKDVQSMISSIEKLEAECSTATDKPLFEAEEEISWLKKKYEDLLLAATEQLEEMGSPVCSFEIDQDTLLSGMLDVMSNEVDEIAKKDKLQKRPLCKSHSQSMNNGNDSSSPDIETDRPNTAANHIGSDTDTLTSPEKQHRQALPMREYLKEPSGHNRSTPTLDRAGNAPYSKKQYFERTDKKAYVPIERRRIMNGDPPFSRKSIQDKLVIQTNYPNAQLKNTFSSPQLPRKSDSIKANKSTKKSHGEMEGSAVGMGVRRVNSCDTTEIIDTNLMPRDRQKENYARREPLRKLTPCETVEEIEPNSNLGKSGRKKNSLNSFKTKKADSKSVKEMVRMFSLNSKKYYFTETKI